MWLALYQLDLDPAAGAGLRYRNLVEDAIDRGAFAQNGYPVNNQVAIFLVGNQKSQNHSYHHAGHQPRDGKVHEVFLPVAADDCQRASFSSSSSAPAIRAYTRCSVW